MICTYASSTPTLSDTSLDIQTTFHPCIPHWPTPLLVTHPASGPAQPPTSLPSSPTVLTHLPLAPDHPPTFLPHSPIPSPLSSPPTVLSLLTYLIPALIPACLSHPHSYPHSPISSQPAYLHSCPHLLSRLELNLDTICGQGMWLVRNLISEALVVDRRCSAMTCTADEVPK